MKVKKEFLFGLVGVLTLIQFYWLPLFGFYNIVKLALGLSLTILGIYFLWHQKQRKLFLLTFLIVFMLGLIPAQTIIFKKQNKILNSPYKEYLTVNSCNTASKLAERDFNTGKLKYFLLSDLKDTILLQTLENKNIQIIDLTSFNAEHLECYNSITTLSLSHYSSVQ